MHLIDVITQLETVYDMKKQHEKKVWETEHSFRENRDQGPISSSLSTQHKAEIRWSIAAQQVIQPFSTDDLTVFLRFWDLQA